MLSAAFGGAFLLAGLTSRSHDSRPYGTPRNSGLDALDHIKDALIGVASIRLTNFIGQAIPCFAQEFKDVKIGLRASQAPRRTEEQTRATAER